MKKILTILLTGALIGAFSIPVFAYNTQVTYEATLNQAIDVDGDGVDDGTISDATPYLLVVPQELSVDGDKDTVYIAGIVDKQITVSVPENVEMTDESGNTLNSAVEMEGETLVLPISLTEVGRAQTQIGTSWPSAPLSGSWSGIFEYVTQ